jgi:SAM-dependent methyltransferase
MRFLPRFFRPGAVDTLDAGCGNGALAYAAYRLGNRVIGITNDPGQVEKAQRYFRALGLDERRLSFALCDLYDLPRLGRQFDQVICSETLEHIRRDDVVVGHFYDCLRPGGSLHLCAPYALHPEHAQGRHDGPEDGSHVRDGYTFETYASLLNPRGFDIVAQLGLGSPALIYADRLVRAMRNVAGDAAALPAFVLTYPMQLLDYTNPRVPYSVYVMAKKVPA